MTWVCSSGDSVQFKMLSMRSEKPICAPTRVSEVFPNVAFERVPANVRLTDSGPLSSCQGRSSNDSSVHASLLQAIDGVTYLALCPQECLNGSSTPSSVRACVRACVYRLCCYPVSLISRWACTYWYCISVLRSEWARKSVFFFLFFFSFLLLLCVFVQLYIVLCLRFGYNKDRAP